MNRTCLPDMGTSWTGVGWQSVKDKVPIQKLEVLTLPCWGNTSVLVTRYVAVLAWQKGLKPQGKC